MTRKPVLGAGLVAISILTTAFVLTSGMGTSEVLGASAGNCVSDLLRQKHAEGLVLTNNTRVDNGDGTVTGIFTFCHPCSNSQPPCQAPCVLAQVTIDLKTGITTCR